MNSRKSTQELLFPVSNFLKIKHFKNKKVNKKEIIFLILILSIFLNTQANSYSTPISKATTKICEDNMPSINTKEHALKKQKTGKYITTSSKELLPVIKLGFEYKNNEDLMLHQQIAISFQESNSFGYDKGYDSEAFVTGETGIYWKFTDDERKYVITGVQEMSEDLEVPLEIKMGYSGQVTLMVDHIQNVSREIYIIDKLTGNSYNAKDGRIEIDLEKGMCAKRFFLAFKETEVLSLAKDLLLKETIIYADNKNKDIVISKNQAITILKVDMFNILGKKVNFWKIKEQQNSYQLDLTKQIPTGIYIVQLNTNKGTMNKKVLIE